MRTRLVAAFLLAAIACQSTDTSSTLARASLQPDIDAEPQRELVPIGGVEVVPVAPVGTSPPSTTAPAVMMTDLPAMSKPRVVENATGGGTWHWLNGVVRDNFGDGQMGLVQVGDSWEYWLVCRMGTSPVGGAFFRKPYDGNPYEWGEISKDATVKAIPGLTPYSHHNIDTHVFAQNPETGVVTFVHGVKPGTRPAGATGMIKALQRATAVDPQSVTPSSFTRFRQELFLQVDPRAPWEGPMFYAGRNEFWGGVCESSILIEPDDNTAVGFYVGEMVEGPDAFGQRGRWRIGRWVAPLLDFDTAPAVLRDPPPSATSYVWDPRRDGGGGDYGDTNATAIWGTCNTVLQQHVSRAPDGSYHLVALGKQPSKLIGVENRSTAVGHWWSHDKGLTWQPDARNPILTAADLGIDLTLQLANRINSPWLMWDPRGKVYLGVWCNRTGMQNQLGTRLVLCEAAIPQEQ